MDEQRQNDQLEPIYNCSMPIQDVALKTSREQRMIETGGERGSGISVLAARHDDDDDNDMYTHIQKYLAILKIFISHPKSIIFNEKLSNVFSGFLSDL